MISRLKCFPAITVFLINIIITSSLNPDSPITIKIGALMETNDDTLVEAFQDALKRYNFNDWRRNRFRLVGKIEFINNSDSFHVSKPTCKLLEDGVWALLGPNSQSISWYLDSLVSHFRIPYVSILWSSNNNSLSPLPSKTTSTSFSLTSSLSQSSVGWIDEDRKYHNFTIKLTPSSKMIGRALESMMNYHGHWKQFTIIYETNEGLIELKNLLGINSATKMMRITVRRYQPYVNSFKKLLRDCKKHGETNFIVNLDDKKILELLNEARKAGLMTEYNNFFLFNLDISSMDLRSFEWIDTNITTFSLLDQQYIDRTDMWIQSDFSTAKHTKLKVASALIYDGVKVLAESIKKSIKDGFYEGPSLTCSSNKFWAQGNYLISTIKSNSFNGLTGPISFNQFGSRISFQLELMKLRKGKFNKIGHWDSNMGLIINENIPRSKVTLMDKLHRKIFRVNSILSHPYLMLKRNHDKMIGNEKFEGFVIDFMDLLQHKLNFSGYTIFLGRDGSYGLSYGNGTWNDVVDNLVSQKADLAIGDLTITRERQEKIDFTFPFINFGISIISRKSENYEFSLTSFLNPFSLQLWFSIGIAFVWVTLTMRFIGRLSPLEWINDETNSLPSQAHLIVTSQIKRNKAKAISAKNNFNLSSCAWFALCSIMQQSSDLSLRSLSTRTLATSWWFFTLIIISSYTANLAAFLTSSKLERPIETLEDLIKQTKVAFGCVKHGATYNFFKKSSDPIHQRLINIMSSSSPSSFVETYEDGLKRVMHENYALFMESTSIVYYANRYCNLTQIGDPLDDRGYGIGLPFGSPYKKLLSEVILWLRENQTIERLTTKWFHEKPKQERTKDSAFPLDCSFFKSFHDLNQLQPGNIGGILILLLLGSALSCILVTIEFTWKTKEVSPIKKDEIDTEHQQLLTFEHHGPSGVHLETVI
ncbi:glutamate receptor ionotropic, kainate 3-like [Tetranychus urticae]|uniref:Ionotropic glutamate receptor C-terminal domain-containing protein n=1 Tax=Tetranychus urticae TaxID=32264 RepID=T1K1L9_TETUR|nr:glutamate receptor ionotropic, kainate 3-like [Tetranychus urticae]